MSQKTQEKVKDLIVEYKGIEQQKKRRRVEEKVEEEKEQKKEEKEEKTQQKAEGLKGLLDKIPSMMGSGTFSCKQGELMLKKNQTVTNRFLSMLSKFAGKNHYPEVYKFFLLLFSRVCGKWHRSIVFFNQILTLFSSFFFRRNYIVVR